MAENHFPFGGELLRVVLVGDPVGLESPWFRGRLLTVARPGEAGGGQGQQEDKPQPD
jgi:hypothetical protein